MVNVAVVGNGKQSNDHLNAWSKFDQVDIVAVVPIDQIDAQNVPETLKDKLVTNLTELNSLEIDLVDLCVPVKRKGEIIRKLYKDGLHILTETPLAADATTASVLLNECKQNNVQLYLSNSLRFSPEFADAKNKVQDGKLGKSGVNRLSTKALHPGPDADIFYDLGTPMFDWLLSTFGEAERVVAKHVKKNRKDGSLVEYALVDIRHTNKSFSHLELSWAGNKKQISFELTGDQGMLTNDSSESNPIIVEGGVGIELEETILKNSVLHRELAHVLEVVGKSQNPIVTAQNAVKAITIAQAAKESVKTGQPVSSKEGVSL